MLSIDLKYPAWTTTMNKSKTSWPQDLLFLLQYIFDEIYKMKENFFGSLDHTAFAGWNHLAQKDPSISAEQGIPVFQDFRSEAIDGLPV